VLRALSEAERGRVRQALDRYCGQDIEGMIWILDKGNTVYNPNALIEIKVLSLRCWGRHCICAAQWPPWHVTDGCCHREEVELACLQMHFPV
jgi:hypothetical protein